LGLGVLEDHADARRERADRLFDRVHPGDQCPPEETPAVELRHDAAKRQTQRRLPGAGRPDQAHKLPAPDFQRDVI